jgi:hypothetical protein
LGLAVLWPLLACFSLKIIAEVWMTRIKRGKNISTKRDGKRLEMMTRLKTAEDEKVKA